MGKQFTADFFLQVMNDNSPPQPPLAISLSDIEPPLHLLSCAVHYRAAHWVNTGEKQRQEGARVRGRRAAWLEASDGAANARIRMGR